MRKTFRKRSLLGDSAPLDNKVVDLNLDNHLIQTAVPKSTNSRNQSLDILRGIAILLVLGSHYDYFHLWARIGWCGVDLFFVLSGFLISGLLFSEYRRTNQIDMMHFWIRRSFKIWPPFYVFMAVTAIALVAEHRILPVGLLHDCLFLGNYLSHFWDHIWSLAVEEHFYLLLPILLVAIIKGSNNKPEPFRIIPSISVVTSIACFYLRSQTLSVSALSIAIQLPTHLRIDSLLAGVSLGYFYHFERKSFRRVRPVWVWIGASVLIVPVILLSVRSVVAASTYTLTSLAFCCAVIAMVERPSSERVIPQALAFIGSYSYSIYLWHAAVISLIFGRLSPTLWLFSAYVLCSIGLGIVMNKLIEKPALYLRDTIFPTHGTPKGVALTSSTIFGQ
jgi:peptidoglycan/LPS O-acetylase OafA/YrhL